MAKKQEKKKEEVKFPVEIEVQMVIEEKPKLGKFDFEFNNEGLNKLRDKLNEVIDFLNK